MSESPAALLIDENENTIIFALDGTTYRVPIVGKMARASDGALINPATEDTLALIKGTDGIKKITDPLPAGTNNIGDFDLASPIPAGTNEVGKVAQGTRAAAGAGWPCYLVDPDGHVVGLYLDGTIYRLQADAKIAIGSSGLVHLDSIDTASGRGRLKSTLYTPDGDPVTFGSVPPNPESILNDFAKHSGSESLLVNGSVTPVEFTYNAHSTEDVSIQEIKFVLSANGITFGTGYFGGVAGPLTNGLLVEITAAGHTGTVMNLNRNESFVHFGCIGGFDWVVSSKDMLSSTYAIGGGLKLKAGTADKVKITVRDNLSAAGIYFSAFVKGNLLPSS